MPLKYFRCPDGHNIATEECLVKCRMEQRCLTRTTLMVIADGDHDWDGVPHVTALLNGTRLEWLRATKDYSIDPRSRAFALLGSSHHKLLEKPKDSGSPAEMLDSYGYVSELPLNNTWVQGTLDLLERDSHTTIMTDAKTWGSNRLVRSLPKWSVFNPSTMVDVYEVTMQMNMYRVLVEELHEIHVNKLQVQCTVRDGGLASATNRGVMHELYLIPIAIIPDDAVVKFFKMKSMYLKSCIDSNRVPEMCSAAEHWNFMRCKKYCDVSAQCAEVNMSRRS